MQGASYRGLMKSLVIGAAALALSLPLTPALAESPTPDPSVSISPSPTPLVAPAVTATQTGQNVSVSWTPVTGATAYTATASSGQTCTTTTEITCLITGLTPRASYTFTVTATDGTQSVTSAPTEPLWLRARLAAPIFDSGKVLVGSSLKGRQIWAIRQGNPLAVNVLLSVGQMHGSEPAGLSVTKGVRAKTVPEDADYQLWTVRTMNPDGAARGNRYNARGIDLNRNFPGTWSRQYRTGSKAASEPETRAMMRFLRKLQPTGVLSFHQPWDTTLSVCDDRSAQWVRLTAKLIKLKAPATPSSCGAWLPGTMNRWVTKNTPAWFVTVELPPNYKVRPSIPRAASAVITLAETMSQADALVIP